VVISKDLMHLLERSSISKDLLLAYLLAFISLILLIDSQILVDIKFFQFAMADLLSWLLPKERTFIFEGLPLIKLI